MIFTLQQAAAVMVGTLAVIMVLYLLRERVRKVTVSYLPLWEQVFKQAPATSLLRRLRRLLSLLLQVAMAALLILAITDTGLGKKSKRKAMAIIIDTSASMAATDVNPSRFIQAVSFARQIARSMNDADKVLVVEMSSSPKVVRSWTSSAEEVISSLDALRISYRGDDFISSLKLGAAALEGMEAPEKEMWVLSDGAFGSQEDSVETLRKTVAEIKGKGIRVFHHRCGKDGANLAITRFSARQDLKEKLKLSSFIVIDAFEGGGGRDKEGRLLVGRGNTKSEGEGRTCRQVRLEVMSGENVVLSTTVEREQFGQPIALEFLAPAGNLLEAKIFPQDDSCGADYLDKDNSTSLRLPEKLTLDILAVTEGNTYLFASLLLSPLWDVEIVGPGEKPSSDFYDVVVSDSAPIPAGVSRKGTLYIKPRAPFSPFPIKGEIEMPELDMIDHQHPVLLWSNLYNVNVARAVHYEIRKNDRVLAASSGVPLIIETTTDMGGAGGTGKGTDLVFAFSLEETDMPLRTAWPLVFINSLYYLAGTTLQVASASNSPQESDIMPRWLPQAARIKAPPPTGRSFPLWLFFLSAALLLNLFEWLSFHRRWTL